MNNFLIGILSSLAAALIWQGLGYYYVSFSTPLDFLATFAGGGVVRKFKSFNQAKRFIETGIKTSREIKFLAVRGFAVTQETYALREAIKNYYTSKNKMIVLLMDPNGDEASKRAHEYGKLHVETEVETYLRQIVESANAILDMKKTTPNLKLYLHNTPAIYRLVIFEKFCLASFYTKKLTGYSSPVLMVRKNSLLYNVFERYFELTLAKSREIVDKLAQPSQFEG